MSQPILRKAHDGLIFDLDGTLWDSTSPVAAAWNRAVHTLGGRESAISTREIESIMGMPHKKIFETIFPTAEDAKREEIAKLCYEEEIAEIRKMGAALYPGVAEGLAKLAEHYPLFIVSNCQTDYLETFFAWTGYEKLFRDSECHGNTGKTKGENIASIKSRNGLATPAYIGDTGSDQEAAIRAGVDYYHVNYGFGRPTRECLEFDKFPDLVSFFVSTR